MTRDNVTCYPRRIEVFVAGVDPRLDRRLLIPRPAIVYIFTAVRPLERISIELKAPLAKPGMVAMEKFLWRVTVLLVSVVDILVPDVPAWICQFILDVNLLTTVPCVDQNVTRAPKVRGPGVIVHEKQAPCVIRSTRPFSQ